MASSLFLKALKASFFSLKRPSDVFSLIDNRDGHYMAVLFESNSSYVGREVRVTGFGVGPRSDSLGSGSCWVTERAGEGRRSEGRAGTGPHRQSQPEGWASQGTRLCGSLLPPCALVSGFLLCCILNSQPSRQIQDSVKHVSIERLFPCLLPGEGLKAVPQGVSGRPRDQMPGGMAGIPGDGGSARSQCQAFRCRYL